MKWRIVEGRPWACAVLLAWGLCLPAAAAEVVIGQVAPLRETNPIGRQVRDGIQAYVDLVNRRGGIHGAMLRFVAKSRGTKAQEVVTKTKELLSEAAPVALVGYMGTGPMEMLVRSGLLDQAGIPLVGIRTGATSLHEPENARWLFHARASYASEIHKILQHVSTIGAHRLAIYHEESAFGAEALRLLDKTAARYGVEIVAKVAEPADRQGLRGAVDRLLRSNANSVLVAGNSGTTADFYQAYRALSGSALVVAMSTADRTLVVKRIGAEAARGLAVTHVVPDPTSRTFPLARELQDLMRRGEIKGDALNQGFAEGYVAAKVLVEALRRAPPQPSRAQVRKALESLAAFDVGGFAVSYSAARRSGSDYVDISIVSRDGKLLR